MRLRAGRGALIRRQRRVALDQLHAIERDAELFGDQLRLRGVEPVTELAFAGVGRHVAVGGDGDPRIELIAAGAVEPLRRQPRRVATAEARRRQPRRAEADDERAGAFQKGSALHAFTPLRVPLDGAKHPRVRGAAAQHAGHRLPDLRVRRFRVPIEERLGGHDDAVDAEAALHRLLVDERLLNRMRLVDRAETFERRDLGARRRFRPG